MTKQNNYQASNFWFGFALGTISVATIAYMIGTKKGRKMLEDLLEYAKSHEDVPEGLLNILPVIETAVEMKENEEKIENVTKTVTTTSSELPEKHIQPHNTMTSLIEKMKQVSEKPKQKKWFVTKK